MNAKFLWGDQVPEKDGIKSAINDVAFSPDGSRVTVAVGNRVLLYNAENGDLLDSLRGHKDTVLSVDFNFDGTRFASGGNDSVVVIWKSTGQGLLKYNHTAPIQRVKYSPTSLKLASCSDIDIGLWSPEQKQVLKEKTPSKILSVAWSTDGTFFAVGMQNGQISVRNQQAEELQRIERKAAVWCLLFIPLALQHGKGSQVQPSTSPQQINSVGDGDALVVGCWDKTLSIYRVQGSSHRIHSEKVLKYYPCSISAAGSNGSKANYMVITGSNKKATLYSREGMKLFDVCTKSSWLWASSCHAQSDRVALGTDHGGIEVLQMSFTAIHSLYRDRYAYRDNLTEIIVHHLAADRKVRIKCKDLVQQISLYKNKLAVQLSDRISIYESSADETSDMHFRLRRERVSVNAIDKPCDQMAVTSTFLVFCRGVSLELYSFDGVRQRVWKMAANIKFMKVEGGPAGREAILLGLENGVVNKVFVDNPFSMEIGKRPSAVICADLSLSRSKLATVDSSNVLLVTDVRTLEVLFTAQGVTSVCFNTEVDDMICYNGASSVFVVSGVIGSSAVVNGGQSSQQPQPQEQHIGGRAIGFQGQKIYCVYRGSIVGVDVPQGQNMSRALESGDFKVAHSIACLGATEADWRLLAMRSLRANCLDVAKDSFARLKESKFLSLIEAIERNATSGLPSAGFVPTVGDNNASLALGDLARKPGARSRVTPATIQPVKVGRVSATQLDITWQAEILAYEGHHHEAAKLYARAGKVDEAIRLFTDLRRWSDAKIFAQSIGGAAYNHLQASLSTQQAKWLQEVNDWRGAAELLVSLGQLMEAAKTVAEAADSKEPGWAAVMVEIVRAATAESKEVLAFCGDKFTVAEEDTYAVETYTKLGDVTKLMSLYARKQMWTEAASLAEKHEGEFDVSVFLPYAEWLITRDRYEEAMQAYRKAGRSDLAEKVLETLTENAVLESRFKDAAYYYWVLAKDSDNGTSASDFQDRAKQAEWELKADLYFAYSNIHAFVTDPFTSHQPEMLFQIARFIMNSLGNSESPPKGISKAATLYTLARESLSLGAYKLARHAYDSLGKLLLPRKKQDEIELDMLIVQSKPVRDDPDHLPVCYRCGSVNPLLNPFTSKLSKGGDVCTNCGHPFVRSFVNFDILPLVEFVPEPSITDEEAIELIRQPFSEDSLVSTGRSANRTVDSKWKESKIGEAETMTFDSDVTDRFSYPDSRFMDTDGDVDLFTNCLNATLRKQGNRYIPITVDANTLLSIKRHEVFICRPTSKAKRATFYRNMLPEIAIAISQPCHRFFHLEDFEFAYLSSKCCPFSRQKSVGEYGSL